MIKLLLAEDDLNLGMLLKEFLQAKKFQVTLAKNGKEALELFEKNEFHFCLLDVMMPVMDGFTLASEIRKTDDQVPIMFLTVNAMKEDVIRGLKIGADDYLTKPFNMEELLYRIHAIIRRTQNNIKEEQTAFKIGQFRFNSLKQELVTVNTLFKLSGKENELLLFFCQHSGQLVERSEVLNKVWGNDDYFTGRSMDVYITRLRKYLKDDPTIEIINVHGIGFKMIC